MKNKIFAFCLLMLIIIMPLGAFAQRGINETLLKNKPPKLVVVITVDQCRADYLTRWKDLFLPAKINKNDPGGFRFLMENGAWFLNTHLKHIPTATGPGHMVIGTGSNPAVSGIIGNSWYDQTQNKKVYCVADPSTTVVGADIPGTSFSPANLNVTSLGDEMRLATANQSKVVSIALKDRAAVLMAGHNPNAVVWFNDKAGKWVTSSFYAKDGKLFSWANEVNQSKAVDAYFGKLWEPEPKLTAGAFTRTTPVKDWVEIPPGFSENMPHKIVGKGEKDADFYRAFLLTPFANEFVLMTAKQALMAEKLGADDIPDLLLISFSSDDYLGHIYGPNSQEVMDMVVKLDKQLADFFQFLNFSVAGGLDEVLIVLTADHGVAPLPDEMKAKKMDAQMINEDEFIKSVDAALDAEYGDEDWVAYFDDPHLYLNKTAAQNKNVEWEALEKTTAKAAVKQTGVLATATKTQVAEGRLPAVSWANLLAQIGSSDRAGDVFVIAKPSWMFGSYKGTTHGSPWPYDTYVPLLMRGPGISDGIYAQSAAVHDIAPTIALILGITPPSGCVGTPLSFAIKK